MALVLADRVKETTTTAGTGAVTLAGASAGFQTFLSTVGDGNTTYYVIAGQGTSEWEVGIGTYTSASNTLSRDTVLSSSNSGSLVTFSSGTKDVWVDYAAGKAVTTDTLAYPPAIGETTPAAGTFTTLTATGQTSLGGRSSDNTDVVRVYKDNTITGQTTSFTAPALSFIPPQSGYGAGILRSSTQLFITTGNTSPLIFQTASTLGYAGIDQMRVSHTASAVNYVQVTGGATGSGPIVSVQGSDTNINFSINTKGSGSVFINQGQNSASGLVLSNAGTAANAARLFFQSSGGTSAISNIGGNILSFNTAATIGSSSGSEQFRVSNTASAVNYVQVTGAATANANGPTISAQGSDATIPLTVIAKGSAGSVVLGSPFGVNFRAVGYAGATVVNNLQAQGSATTLSPVLSATGTDTNISQVFQSKGTGAIDLAAGSSGVNISNGGTVTALTQTSGGSYTSIPTVAISAPTTAGGVQATATVSVQATSGTTLASGGSGYTVGDVITVSGGTFVTQAQFSVATVSAGAITSLTQTVAGNYSVVPSSPASVTGGTGSGATLTMQWTMRSGTFVITNAGSGYVEQPTVTFSGGGGSGAAAYATVGGQTIVRALGAQVSFYTPNGEGFRVQDGGSTSTSYWTAYGTSSTPSLRAVSAVSGSIETASAVPIQFKTSTSLEQLRITHTASAVNYVQVTGAATGGQPYITAQGSDTTVGLSIASKGTSFIYLRNAGTTVQFSAGGTSSAVNYLNARGNAAGTGPALEAVGSDTNIPLVLQPKGTGALQAQQTDSTATGGNARGANAVDWQTLRSAANQVSSGQLSVLGGGRDNVLSGALSVLAGGGFNGLSGQYAVISGGAANSVSQYGGVVVGGQANAAGGWFNFVGGGFTNSATSGTTVTTQATTTVTSGSTAVTLSGSNANIKVGQLISGTGINTPTYVAAISGTSLTLSQNAAASGTPTLSFYTPHGVVVGGGNNQATGSYSFIGGGGDAGTAANRNVASGDWSTVAGGLKNQATGTASVVAGGGFDGSFISGNTASGILSVVSGGTSNTASGVGSTITGGYNNGANSTLATINGGRYGSTRGVSGYSVFPSCNQPMSTINGASQGALLILARQTTDATATVLCSDGSAAGTTNQVILPNNSAYYFRGTVVAGVTGAGNTSSWSFEGTIKRGANAASTALVGTPVLNLIGQDSGASTWVVALTADTTNGGLAVTVTGQASTTIRWVAKIETTEMTF